MGTQCYRRCSRAAASLLQINPPRYGRRRTGARRRVAFTCQFCKRAGNHYTVVLWSIFDPLSLHSFQAASFWASALRVRPVLDEALHLAPALQSSLGFDPGSNFSVADADLVLIITARPSPPGYAATTDGASSYAKCLQVGNHATHAKASVLLYASSVSPISLQRDQYRRCTVGLVNVAPESLDISHAAFPDVVQRERHAAVHLLVREA